MSLRFNDINPPAPTEESIARDYAALNAALDRGDRAQVVRDWDRQARDYATWSAVVSIHANQNVNDPAAEAADRYADNLGPKRQELSVDLTRRLLADPDRKGLETLVGAHAVHLWQTGIATFDPLIKDDLEEESKLTRRYRKLIADGTVTLDGKTMGLGGLSPLGQSLHRETRRRASKAMWGFYEANGEELGEIFDKLVHVRDGMATKLGETGYTPLAYQLNGRIGFDASDVAQYREQLAAQIVPVVGRILDKRQADFGWDHVYSWDSRMRDPKGNPKPVGGHDALMAAAGTMFRAMDPRLSELFEDMTEGGFFDLEDRPGKAYTAFCTTFPSLGMPYVFGGFEGVYADISQVVHEFGHAFQNWMSRNQPVIEYLQPSNEAGEIPSKGLEYLTYGFIEPMVEKGAADRYRRAHLTSAICAMPDVLLVDHFQHEVYANPSATTADRNEMWRELEKKYQPRLDYGDMDYPATGARWQTYRHIFASPFYNIDYNMAEGCALQLLARSRDDFAGTMETYVDLCKRGGERPFLELIKDAGLASPFDPDAMTGVLQYVETELGLATVSSGPLGGLLRPAYGTSVGLRR